MRTVIVGGGVIGLSTAYFLQRAGADVTVITAGRVGEGASAVNAGWVVPALSGPVPAPGLLSGSLRWMLSPTSPFYARPNLDPAFLRWLLEFRSHCNVRDFAASVDAIAELNRATIGLYDQLRADGVAFEEHRTGLVMAYRTVREAEHEIEASRWFDKFGYGPAIAGRAQDLEPALADDIRGAYFLPVERHVDPASLTAGLAACIRERGGTILENERVLRLEPAGSGGRGIEGSAAAVAIGTADRWQADAIVVAAGAWTPTLLRGLRVRVPIVAGKGYSLDFTPPPVSVGHALYLHDFRVAASPYPGRLRLSGTMELTGLDTGISPRRVDAIARAGARFLRGWPTDAPPPTVGSGLRPLTPDGLPVIGPLPRTTGVWVASGHSMLGVTLGPATGAALAAAMTGRSPDVLRPFDPARFM